jgi:hypothetical protein
MKGEIMTAEISDRIRGVGPFEALFIHCIDLYALLDSASKSTVRELRASDSVSARLSGVFSQAGVSAGTFHLAKYVQDSVQNRVKFSVETFEKSVPTSMFYEKVPFLFEEREGQKLSDTTDAIRLGRTFDVKEIFSSTDSVPICYEDCELRIFRDGILSIRFKFSGKAVPIDAFIQLIIELKKLTRTAMLDKTKLIIKEFGDPRHPFTKTGLRFLDSQEIFAQSVYLRHFSSDHAVIVMESMLDSDGSSIPVSELESQPGLLGVLRQTHRAIGYKRSLLDDIARYNQGYKSDEIYITLRGTTLIVLPNHWQPHNYLSFYIEDLLLFIEYYVSKITYLDTLALAIEKTEILNEPIENIKVTRDLVNQIISLRRILLLTEENLDVDLLVNHYFTRGVLLQLIEQRGIANKLESIRKRINNMDRILDLIANSSFSQMGVGSGLLQVRIAAMALIATLLFSLLALIFSLIQLLK